MSQIELTESHKIFLKALFLFTTCVCKQDAQGWHNEFVSGYKQIITEILSFFTGFCQCAELLKTEIWVVVGGGFSSEIVVDIVATSKEMGFLQFFSNETNTKVIVKVKFRLSKIICKSCHVWLFSRLL